MLVVGATGSIGSLAVEEAIRAGHRGPSPRPQPRQGARLPPEAQVVVGERQAGDSSDGVIARRQVAEVLVRSLTSAQAERKTFELVATTGAEQQDFEP